jgi:cation diffusion facilitator CzcD-associated flavoprotein CzcO
MSTGVAAGAQRLDQGSNQARRRDRCRSVIVVGGGFSGIGMAIRLRQSGVEDFVVLERAEEVGGTWRDNRYPGAACDVRSHLYSFSFAPNPEWSRSYSPQSEIRSYLESCVDRFSLRDRLQLKHEVLEARWHDHEQEWEVDTNEGRWWAPVVVWATGPLSEPRVPALEGAADFRGRIFHSAAWPPGFGSDSDLAGRRVAVVGTGASAIQIVPAVQPVVERLVVFQRTPAWIVPRRDHPIGRGRRWLYRRFPVAQRALRAGLYLEQELLAPVMMARPRAVATVEALARKHLEAQVPDPELRATLTPSFRIGCKRIMVSDDYYPALGQPNVEVVSAAARLTPDALIDDQGVSHHVDTVIFATGFNAAEPSFPANIVGRHDRRLADSWREGREAYLGTVVHGFPNLFMLLGPNTVLGHNSVVFMIESQLSMILDYLRYRVCHGIRSAEVRHRVQAIYNLDLQRRLVRSIWTTGGCGSWYLDRRGRNTTLWPGFTLPYRVRTRRFHPEDYVLR